MVFSFSLSTLLHVIFFVIFSLIGTWGLENRVFNFSSSTLVGGLPLVGRSCIGFRVSKET
jgi:hypothetical protein